MADAAPGNATRGINKSAIIGKSNARTQRDEPIVAFRKLLDNAKGRQKRRLTAVVAAPRHVAFEAPDEVTNLLVEPDLQSAGETVGVRIAAGVAVIRRARDRHTTRKRRCGVVEVSIGIGKTKMTPCVKSGP